MKKPNVGDKVLYKRWFNKIHYEYEGTVLDIEEDCGEHFITCDFELKSVCVENEQPITSLRQKFKRQVSLTNLRPYA